MGVCAVKRIGILETAAADPDRRALWEIFERRLRELGHANGTDEVSRFFVDPNAIGPLPPNPKKAFLDIQLLLVNTTVSPASTFTCFDETTFPLAAARAPSGASISNPFPSVVFIPIKYFPNRS